MLGGVCVCVYVCVCDVCTYLGPLCGDDLVVAVALVSHEKLAGALAGITIHLVEPVLDVFEGFLCVCVCVRVCKYMSVNEETHGGFIGGFRSRHTHTHTRPTYIPRWSHRRP